MSSSRVDSRKNQTFHDYVMLLLPHLEKSLSDPFCRLVLITFNIMVKLIHNIKYIQIVRLANVRLISTGGSLLAKVDPKPPRTSNFIRTSFHPDEELRIKERSLAIEGVVDLTQGSEKFLENPEDNYKQLPEDSDFIEKHYDELKYYRNLLKKPFNSYKNANDLLRDLYKIEETDPVAATVPKTQETAETTEAESKLSQFEKFIS
ncbi:Hypothetical protein PAS_chr1-4_0635 [Komagataella phaffii GS115]|uniref:Uncharacterized protein n=1 Tax=Komagataella phaffii (strain GS115 / ATCC 20864) TaxID=644223 RepID=C4QZ22_KOMPG|nr:Hypothetical protein PAS_chr1-4_0635 [Komagataella phaffii GS115]CAY68496.1 Hypothetical protein PAS_chr1-4_0635 [Komagataella phaffii GS115]